MLHAHLTTLNAVSLVLDTFKAQGLPSEALLAGSGICAADLSRADTRITTNQEMRVCANAVALRRDVGLVLGRQMHVSAYGMLGYALLTSATFGDALRLALRYPALLGTLFKLSLEADGERIWFTAADYRETPAMQMFNVELCLASLKVICDDLLGQPLALLGARFEYSAPDYRARYSECFACPLQFDAGTNAFAFDKRWLDQPLPLARRRHAPGHGRAMPQTEPGVHRPPGVAGQNPPVAHQPTRRRAGDRRPGRTDELLAAHPAPPLARPGVQLSGTARRTALRARQAMAGGG